MASAPPPLPLTLRFVRALAVLAAMAVLAFVIAFWGWRWFGPSVPPPPPPHEPTSWASTIAASPIFGRASTPSAASGPVAQATLGGDTRLLGVFAERDGGGYALFRLPGKGPVLVRSGDTLVDGVKIVAVRPDGVRIDDHGEPRDIVLRPASQPRPTTTPAATAASNAAARATCALPPGYRGPVYRLNAELLTGLTAQPASWQALVAPADGALVVREGNALASALGLSPGDRIAQANGIALARIEDVLNAVVQPLLESRPVRLTGTHDGRATEWVLVNASACPA